MVMLITIRNGFLIQVIWIIAGDAVDGIDSYPGQEADLSITDVWEQYAELSKSVNRIPTEIQTVIMPGNHDAVRLMEPQLPLPDKVVRILEII